MTDTFYYTDFKQTDSSAVHSVYYDGDSQMMVVVLVNGNQYGYDGVLSNEYNDFITAFSVGAHYNTYIKGIFDTFVANYTHFESSCGTQGGPAPVADETNTANDEPVETGERLFTVHYTVVGKKLSLGVVGDSVEDVLARFKEGVDAARTLLGMEEATNVVVTGVTTHF